MTASCSSKYWPKYISVNINIFCTFCTNRMIGVNIEMMRLYADKILTYNKGEKMTWLWKKNKQGKDPLRCQCARGSYNFLRKFEWYWYYSTYIWFQMIKFYTCRAVLHSLVTSVTVEKSVCNADQLEMELGDPGTKGKREEMPQGMGDWPLSTPPPPPSYPSLSFWCPMTSFIYI